MMVTPELIEQLADAEHASWASWMAYLFSRCEPGPDGALVIRPSDVEHWRRQINTSYADLTEREKASDRIEVMKIVPLIEATTS
jgi:hypothetical protein